MSQRILGVLAAACFAIAAPIANADTPCGCGQVVSPMGAVYGGSVVDPYNAGGVVYGGGQIMGRSWPNHGRPNGWPNHGRPNGRPNYRWRSNY